MQITDLPDFPAIRQIQSALWRTGETRGAAVMVGAGLSRGAQLAAENSKMPPLWTDFHAAMASTLYPNGGAPYDSLRLAEEYKAVLGEPALDGLIFNLVRDTEWAPGLLHEKLLLLPWSDVLTTNWDTLLERAAAVNTTQNYDVVFSVRDIPRTRAPRVVKLHGSMPANRPFILTEEDYRTYPSIFAPMVNLVQQVMLENELCLVGFSGDDPNFLKWSGWVRDQLGAASRRIHLIGVLNLSPARRKFLEARNVSPVDLAPLVGAADSREKHRIALERFLDFLIKCKPRPPYDWPLQSSKAVSDWANKPIETRRGPAAGAKHLEEMAELWRRERESYPAWYVCPPFERHKLRWGTDAGVGFKAALEQLPALKRGNVIYEIAWRFDTAFWPLSAWLVDALTQATENPKAIGLETREHCFLLSLLLRNARERNAAADFERWKRALQTVGVADKDLLVAGRYEECLWARDHMDYSRLTSLVDSVQGQDPAWKIRRAALLCELGDMDLAAAAIKEALEDIRERRGRERNSIWLISRLAWAQFLARMLRVASEEAQNTENPSAEPDTWPPIFHEMKCDPWDALNELDRQLDEAFRKQAKEAVTKWPRFDPGTYVARNTEMRFKSETVVSPSYEAYRLADWVALPPIARHTDVMQTRLFRAAELLDPRDEGGLLASIRVLHGDNEDLMEKRFGRIEVARMPEAVVGRLTDVLWQAIGFGAHRITRIDKTGNARFDAFWIDRLRAYLEIQSRLVVRLSESEALDAFMRAVSLAKDAKWNHWWLFKPLGHLLERSLTTVSPNNRPNLLLEVLNFPLPDERDVKGREEEWPELIETIGRQNLVRPESDLAFHGRILKLIEKVRSSPTLTRSRAALRLVNLLEAKAMSSEEISQFSEALWSRLDSNTGLPSETDLLAHVFLIVPTADINRVQERFRSEVVAPLTKNGVSWAALAALRGACHRSMGLHGFKITGQEAKAILDSVVAWKPKQSEFDFGQNNYMNRQIGSTIGPVLADAVLPMLDSTDLSAEQINKLFDLIETEYATSTIVALPEISRLHVLKCGDIVNVIHRGLLSSSSDAAAYSINAIRRWTEREKAGALQPCPTELIEAATAIVWTRKEPGFAPALHLVTALVTEKRISPDVQSRLVDTLTSLRQETAYESWRVDDSRTTTITLVRAHCVRLANSLKATHGDHPTLVGWLKDAKTDPMPEVRQALQEQSDTV